ncbi:MAG: hypothetical protein IT366_01115 [Candidatus Hydrogenedentes bacterium]|nr:hypothetical protein [Candidatus Hydrogenedentota bacterium]
MLGRFLLESFVAVALFSAQRTETPSPHSRELIIGVLESPAATPDIYVARVAFKLTEKGWESFPTDFDTPEALRNSFHAYPQLVHWMALYRGSEIGELSGIRNDSVAAYSHVGMQKIGLECPISRIGTTSLEFAGWPCEPTYRPLLLCTRKAADPDHWIESTLTKKEIARFEKHLRTAFPSTPQRWAQKSIEIGQVFESKKRNSKLIQVSLLDDSSDAAPILPATLETTVGDEPPASDDKVFFLQRHGEYSIVGPKLTYLDAADFNGDGKSEIVFMLQAYNRDGYVLLDDQGGVAKFTWNYH